MKKQYTITIVCIFLVAVLTMVYFLLFRTKKQETLEDVDYLNDVVDCYIMIYERDLVFSQDNAHLKRTVVSDLSETTLVQDHDYIYLILDDRDGDLSLNREDLDHLISLWKTHSNFNFYYVGRGKLEMIGELMNDPDIYDEDMSYGCIHMGTDPLVLMGTWDLKSQESYENAIINPDDYTPEEYDRWKGSLAGTLIRSMAIDIRQSEMP